MQQGILRKSRWYPRPHSMDMQWFSRLENGHNNKTATILPAIMYDEGLGSPSTYNANPEHASFAEVAAPNCFPESSINKISCFLEVSMMKQLLETDKINAIKVAFMPIFTAFEDIDIRDEKTTETIGSILRLQKESTDRQCYPIFNTYDVDEQIANAANFDGNMPGLTTDQKLEHVVFDEDKFYNALQYFSISKALAKRVGGLKWVTLTRQNPVRRFKINLRSKTKYLNPYTFFGLMCIAPQVTDIEQLPGITDTTNQAHVLWRVTTRYDEWNEHFDMERV